MMIDNLTEAIKEYEDFAECETETARVLRNIGNEKDAKYYEETAENDKKIVAWLTELQERREEECPFTWGGDIANKEAIRLIREHMRIHSKKEPAVSARLNKAFLIAIEKLKAERWIPVSEKLPDDLEPVNITWINHDPEPYYKEIKDKPFTATGVYFNGQWYWWSTLCTDILAEYSHNFDDVIDSSIEITHWKPLPKPYTESDADGVERLKKSEV